MAGYDGHQRGAQRDAGEHRGPHGGIAKLKRQIGQMDAFAGVAIDPPHDLVRADSVTQKQTHRARGYAMRAAEPGQHHADGRDSPEDAEMQRTEELH
jgi:hypothetical protein